MYPNIQNLLKVVEPKEHETYSLSPCLVCRWLAESSALLSHTFNLSVSYLCDISASFVWI